jgi:hypothetical protein
VKSCLIGAGALALAVILTRGPWAGAPIAVLRGLGAEGSTMPTDLERLKEIEEEFHQLDGQLETVRERLVEATERLQTSLFNVHKAVAAAQRAVDA